MDPAPNALERACAAYANYDGQPWCLVATTSPLTAVPAPMAQAAAAATEAPDFTTLLYTARAADMVWRELSAWNPASAVLVDGGLSDAEAVMSLARASLGAGLLRLSSGPKRAHRVLLTEDNLPMARIITLVLAREGLDVLHAATGEQALTLLDRNNPSDFLVIMLDRHLPGIDGLALLDHLEALTAWQNIPVWMCSAADGTEFLQRSTGRVPEGYLRKPFRPAELVDMVRDAGAVRRRSEG